MQVVNNIYTKHEVERRTEQQTVQNSDLAPWSKQPHSAYKTYIYTHHFVFSKDSLSKFVIQHFKTDDSISWENLPDTFSTIKIEFYLIKKQEVNARENTIISFEIFRKNLFSDLQNLLHLWLPLNFIFLFTSTTSLYYNALSARTRNEMKYM